MHEVTGFGDGGGQVAVRASPDGGQRPIRPPPMHGRQASGCTGPIGCRSLRAAAGGSERQPLAASASTSAISRART